VRELTTDIDTGCERGHALCVVECDRRNERDRETKAIDELKYTPSEVVHVGFRKASRVRGVVEGGSSVLDAILTRATLACCEIGQWAFCSTIALDPWKLAVYDGQRGRGSHVGGQFGWRLGSSIDIKASVKGDSIVESTDWNRSIGRLPPGMRWSGH
jgi:hypothetical protein